MPTLKEEIAQAIHPYVRGTQKKEIVEALADRLELGRIAVLSSIMGIMLSTKDRDEIFTALSKANVIRLRGE